MVSLQHYTQWTVNWNSILKFFPFPHAGNHCLFHTTWKAGCICSPPAVKKRHLFTNIWMLRLGFLQGFYIAISPLAIIVGFHIFTQHCLYQVIEASHHSPFCVGDHCKTPLNHSFPSAAALSNAQVLQHGLARRYAEAASPLRIPLTFVQMQSLLSWADPVASQQLVIPRLKTFKVQKRVYTAIPECFGKCNIFHKAVHYSYPLPQRSSLGTLMVIVNLQQLKSLQRWGTTASRGSCARASLSWVKNFPLTSNLILPFLV